MHSNLKLLLKERYEPSKWVQIFHVSVWRTKADLRHSFAEFNSGRWLSSRYSLSLRKFGSDLTLINPHFCLPLPTDDRLPSLCGLSKLTGTEALRLLWEVKNKNIYYILLKWTNKFVQISDLLHWSRSIRKQAIMVVTKGTSKLSMSQCAERRGLAVRWDRNRSDNIMVDSRFFYKLCLKCQAGKYICRWSLQSTASGDPWGLARPSNYIN